MTKLFLSLALAALTILSPDFGWTRGAAKEGSSSSGTMSTPGGSQHDQARAQEGASSGGSGVNAMVSAGMFAAGAACMAACSGGCGYCYVLLGMGAVSALQSKEHARDAYDASQLAMDVGLPDYKITPLDTDGDGIPDFNDPFYGMDPSKKVPFGPYGTIGEIQDVMAANDKFMAEQGLRVNDDGSVTLKDGTVIPASAISAGANGDGLRLEDAEKVKKLMAKAKKAAADADKYKVASMGFDSGGGGGGSDFKYEPYKSDFDMSKYLNGFNKKKKRGIASVIGKSKRVGGEPIGVAGDDIFAMITRRYKAKSRTNTFIGRSPKGR